MTNPVFQHLTHEVDFCVIGGGMPGLAAALSAARHGAKVLLMQDRPVLGGNASSECRVHVCGADVHNHYKNMRETGILEELRLENLSRNPNKNYSIWDTILYEKAKAEPNLTLLLNCTCMEVEKVSPPPQRGWPGIRSVTGWQLTTQTYHTVRAEIFADCSGDAILVPLTGALFRMGREARHEYIESIAPEAADNRTMGMTCLFQARQYPTPQPFEPLPWANRYERCEDLPYGYSGEGHSWWQMGYWWVELGGEWNTIRDTEYLRDELLKVVYGVWDHLKNRCAHRKEVENWAIEWVQFLPAKRESRRYAGEYILKQKDIESGGHFEDRVAYGGWSMDDHHPAGFEAVRIGAPATIFHPAPSPYGIPYRALFSRNIPNLMFAGRDASCTHAAMSSTRVMGTGISMGQAVGTAAALAIQKGIGPAGMKDHMHELQQALLRDDAYIPWIAQEFSDLTNSARLEASQGDPEPVRDGTNRPVGEQRHSWLHHPGDWIACRFDAPAQVETVSLVLDSCLEQKIALSYHQADDQLTAPPTRLPKAFRIDGLVNGEWTPLANVTGNHQRLVRLPVGRQVEGIRFTLQETWGDSKSELFAFYVN